MVLWGRHPLCPVMRLWLGVLNVHFLGDLEARPERSISPSIPIWISSDFEFFILFLDPGGRGASGMDPARSGDRFAQMVVNIGALGVDVDAFLRHRLKVNNMKFKHVF